MNRNKALVLILCGLAVFLSAQLARAVEKSELIYASTKDIRDINPHMYMGEMAAQNMVFDSLVVNEPGGAISPSLAESWEISPDGLVYTFKLKKNVNYSDGQPFTAHDAKLNIEAVIANRQRHAWLELVNQIDKADAPDGNTLILTLKEPYYPTLVELGLIRPFRFISPKCFKDGQTKDGVGCYIGTGPWVLAEHKKNQFAVFKANDQYRGSGPRLSSIRWRVIPEHQSIILALQKGDVDLIFGSDGDMVDMDSFRALESQGRYAAIGSPPIASRAIVLNTKQPGTNERAVREALSMAVDRKSIVAWIMNDSETEAESLLARTVPYCDVDLPVFRYDLKKAAALLDQAGWVIPKGKTIREKDGRPLKLKFSYNNNNASERTISEFIQGEMKSIGIDIQLLGEEKQAFLDRQKTGDFGLQYSLSWGPPYDPQSYFSSFRTPAHADYQAQLGLKEKAQLDKMISTLLISTDEGERQRLYAGVLTILARECVYIPLSYSRTKAIHVPRLKGVGFGASQYEIPFRQMYFE